MHPNDPRHGTNAGALAHSRAGTPTCDPCRQASTRRRKANEVARANGRTGRVPLGMKAHHIVTTTPRNQLCAATGFTHERIRRYELGGPTMLIRPETVLRLLQAGSKPAWTPIGIQRRLQGLAALGWSAAKLARPGLSMTTIHKIRRVPGGPKFVRVTVAETVVALFDDLCMTPAPGGVSATETRNNAQGQGWMPPLAWDDIDNERERPKVGRRTLFDHRPKHEIDEVIVQRVLDGDNGLVMTTAERFEVMLRWLAAGKSERSLCERMGWKETRYSGEYVVGQVVPRKQRDDSEGEAA